jgi:hypothetical protein
MDNPAANGASHSETPTLSGIGDRIDEQRLEIQNAMGVLDCVLATLPDDFHGDTRADAKAALRAAHTILARADDALEEIAQG